jgi:HEAT repeat protein
LNARDDKKAPEPPKPTEEQIKAWLKKLEEPTRHYQDPMQGPPDEGIGPDFEYRIHREALLLARAGEAARPGVFALLEDTKRSGQARAHAAIVLVEWLKGTGAKQKPDPKILAALKDALKSKDQALTWGMLDWAQRYGKARALEWVDRISPTELKVPREWYYFSDEAMDGLLPEIIALVANEEPMIAATAADTISAFGRPKQGVKELLAVLDRREPRLRVAAVFALSRVGTDDPAVLKTVLGQLKPEHYGDYYRVVVGAVGNFGPKAKDAVPALIEILKKSEWKRREFMFLEEAAIETLGKIGSDAKEAAPFVVKYAESGCVGSNAMALNLVSTLDRIDPESAKKVRALYKLPADTPPPPKKP